MARTKSATLKWLCCHGILLVSLTAKSYPSPVDFNGKIERWRINPEQPFLIYEASADDDADLERLSPFIDSAANIWNQVSTSLVKLETNADYYPHISVILRNKDDSNEYSAGYAEFDAFDKYDHPIHCNLVVYVGNSNSIYDLAKTILHEFGHCLGLGHSLIPQSIMSYRLDKNSFGLDVDDEAAISRLYPLDDNPRLAPGCAIYSGQRREEKNPILVFFLALPLIFSFFHCRQRRVT